jgi:hypothetical protein
MGEVGLSSCTPVHQNLLIIDVIFSTKRFREEYRGHVINRDGGEYRLDVGESSCMVKFIGFDSSKFSMGKACGRLS